MAKSISLQHRLAGASCMTFALLAVAGCGAGSSGDGMTSSDGTSSSATTLASTSDAVSGDTVTASRRHASWNRTAQTTPTTAPVTPTTTTTAPVTTAPTTTTAATATAAPPDAAVPNVSPPAGAVLKPVPPQQMPSKLLYTYFELYGAGNVTQATTFNQLNIFQGVFAQLSNPSAPATGELLPNYYSYAGATKEMVQAKREAGMRVGFTLGGEGAGGTINMANYQTVARSVINMIVEKWGIIDFVDWNNFEADLYSDPAAMAAASRLISNYFSGTHSAANDPTTGTPHAFPNRDLGQNFYIGSAPGAFDAAGMGGNIAVAIKNEMGLTRSYIGPQAYDGPGFELPSANQNRLNQWVSRGFPLSNIVWGSHPTTVNYSMSPDQSLAFYNTNAGLKGLYTFSYDDAGNLSWVQKMSPQVLSGL